MQNDCVFWKSSAVISFLLHGQRVLHSNHCWSKMKREVCFKKKAWIYESYMNHIYIYILIVLEILFQPRAALRVTSPNQLAGAPTIPMFSLIIPCAVWVWRHPVCVSAVSLTTLHKSAACLLREVHSLTASPLSFLIMCTKMRKNNHFLFKHSERRARTQISVHT